MYRRKSIYVSGFGHRNPVPAACRIGPFLYSGGIHGQDPATGEAAEGGLERQCAFMFSHIRAVLSAAGASPDDIIKMTIWMQEPGAREVLNRHWIAMFPDAETRPTRHVMRGTPRADMLIQADFVAILDGQEDEPGAPSAPPGEA